MAGAPGQHQLISTAAHERLPESYVRPEPQRPRLDEVVADADIPVVDLAGPDVVALIGAACRTHGFFQVLNHGVPEELMQAMLAVAYDFFRLPPEEKGKLYSDDPAKKMRLSTSFNVRKETVHNWRDYLRLHCHPLDRFVPDWPDNPPSFREIVSRYCREVRELGFRLYGTISESLGLEEEYIKAALGEQEQHMAVNFYPKCPAPELTYGLPAHTDPNAWRIFSVGMPGNHSLQATSYSSASTTGVGSGMIRFLLDSGASIHVVGDARLLCGVRRLPAGAAARFATLPDGTRLPIIGVGAIQMESFCIPDVYLVEGVTVNLISVGRLATNHGICCCFYRNRCQLLMLAGGNTVGEAVLDDDGVYGLRFLRIPEAAA